MKSVKSFLKSQDQLGSPVYLNYKRQTTFGTIMGGCISVCTNIFFAIFILLQVWTWTFVKPQFDQSLSTTYLPQNAAVNYEIPVEMFLPTFTVGAIDIDPRQFKGHINDPEMWDFRFEMSNNFIETEVPVVKCTDLIESWTHLSDAQREMFLEEVPFKERSLCPNTTEITLAGGIVGRDSLKLSAYNVIF